MPRRSNQGGFQRNTPARRSTGIMENNVEYFVPRSFSEFNLSGVGDLAVQQQTYIKKLPQHQQQCSSNTLQPYHSLQQQHQQQKTREKMVTFEDESKCSHGVSTTLGTPRKGQIFGDVFM